MYNIFGHQWHCHCMQSHHGTVDHVCMGTPTVQVTQSSDFTALTTDLWSQHKDLVMQCKVDMILFLVYKSAHLKLNSAMESLTHGDCSISHLICYNSYCWWQLHLSRCYSWTVQVLPYMVKSVLFLETGCTMPLLSATMYNTNTCTHHTVST